MVTLSILIGLAIGTLVTRGVTLLGERDEVEFHWLPVTWAVCILAWTVHFTYIGWQINDFTEWRYSMFLLLLAILVGLYGASELILPNGEPGHRNLLAHFERQGTVALALLLLGFVLAIPMNILILDRIPLYEGGPIEPQTAASIGVPMPGIICIGWSLWARSVRARTLPAILFAAYTVFVYASILIDEG